jgi:hypothetical protein
MVSGQASGGELAGYTRCRTDPGGEERRGGGIHDHNATTRE